MTGNGLRRTLHVSTAAVALLVLVSPAALRLGTAYLAVTMLVLEVLRLRSDPVAAALARWLPVYRDRERERPSGALWLFLAYAGCAWFPPPAAVAGILTGGLADPAGSAVGSRLGRRPGKSLAGSVAVAVVAVAAIRLAGASWLAAAVGGLASAVAERVSGPIDDNLVVAPVAAAVVAALA